MNQRTETFLWLGGAGILLAVLYWLSKRASNTTVVQSNPTYTGYNISPGSWSGTSSGLPTLPAVTDSSDCGCTSANGGSFFGSLGDMLNQYMQGATAAFNTYESNVAALYPDWVTQYFNNPTGVSQWQASTRILTDPSQSALNDYAGTAPNTFSG
jgi:hypothetical protein